MSLHLPDNRTPADRTAPGFRPLPLRAGFTLMELLMVMAVIGILAGILFPAATSAMNAAKKTTAKNQAVQIATAISAYETEYGRFPTNASGQIDSSLVTILCTSNDAVNNPRGIIFLEATAWKTGKGGTNSSGAFCDPFQSNTPYSVAMDSGYSNSISIPSQATPGGPTTMSNLTKHVGVWTLWTNGTNQWLIDSWD
jgi:prepilin-type N-terminal cleavage/methylation domain-containing protein